MVDNTKDYASTQVSVGSEASRSFERLELLCIDVISICLADKFFYNLCSGVFMVRVVADSTLGAAFRWFALLMAQAEMILVSQMLAGNYTGFLAR